MRMRINIGKRLAGASLAAVASLSITAPAFAAGGYSFTGQRCKTETAMGGDLWLFTDVKSGAGIYAFDGKKSMSETATGGRMLAHTDPELTAVTVNPRDRVAWQTVVVRTYAGEVKALIQVQKVVCPAT